MRPRRARSPCIHTAPTPSSTTPARRQARAHGVRTRKSIVRGSRPTGDERRRPPAHRDHGRGSASLARQRPHFSTPTPLRSRNVAATPSSERAAAPPSSPTRPSAAPARPVAVAGQVPAQRVDGVDQARRARRDDDRRQPVASSGRARGRGTRQCDAQRRAASAGERASDFEHVGQREIDLVAGAPSRGGPSRPAVEHATGVTSASTTSRRQCDGPATAATQPAARTSDRSTTAVRLVSAVDRCRRQATSDRDHRVWCEPAARIERAATRAARRPSEQSARGPGSRTPSSPRRPV